MIPDTLEPPSTPSHQPRGRYPAKPFSDDFAKIALIGAALYGFEWLFFSTKISFLSALPLPTRVSLLLATSLPLIIAGCALQSVFIFFSRLLKGDQSQIVRALLPAALLTPLLILLIDNFTYVLFKFGIVGSSGFVRVLYAIVYLVIFVQLVRTFAQSDAGSRGFRRAALAVALIASATMIFEWARSERVEIGQPVRSAGAKRPNILFMSTDGIDSAHMSLYGYPQDTTPFLRGLASSSIVFDNAFSNVGRTYGSLTTMLTGRLPTETKVAFPPNILTGATSFRHFPYLLRQLGYTNLQTTMRYYADAADTNMLLAFDRANYRKSATAAQRFLLATGATRLLPHYYFATEVWHRIVDRFQHVFGLQSVGNPFAFVTDASSFIYFADTERLIESEKMIDQSEQPWFLHVHLTDTHCCTFPNTLRGTAAAYIGSEFKQPYERAIRRADWFFQLMYESLEKRGMLDDTIVVYFADHGPGWESRYRVPLLIRIPGGEARRVKSNAQLVDVAPTILELLGQPTPAWMSGKSLLEPNDPLRPVFSINQVDMKVHGNNRYLKELEHPGPPYYGATTFAMIVCDRWYELVLQSGELKSGPILGHTAPCPPESLPTLQAARKIMEDHLRQNGYAFETPPASRAKAE